MLSAEQALHICFTGGTVMKLWKEGHVRKAAVDL